jgi:hypothetical protein
MPVPVRIIAIFVLFLCCITCEKPLEPQLRDSTLKAAISGCWKDSDREPSNTYYLEFRHDYTYTRSEIGWTTRRQHGTYQVRGDTLILQDAPRTTGSSQNDCLQLQPGAYRISARGSRPSKMSFTLVSEQCVERRGMDMTYKPHHPPVSEPCGAKNQQGS